MHIIHEILDPVTIIETIGLIGVWFIVFAESGLFFGFFFPGDSLLFTAGFLASQHFFPDFSIGTANPIIMPAVILLFIGSFCAAIIGDNFGFAFGRRVGPSLFSREDSFLFNKKNPLRAQKFYEKHGKKMIILARFVPIVRTFAPIVAGIGSMNYRTFFAYNVIGGFGWTGLAIFMGFFLGKSIPHAENYVTPLVILILLLSFAPIIFEYIRNTGTDGEENKKI